MIERLFEQLRVRGLEVRRGANWGELVLAGPGAEKTAEVMAALKAHRPELVKAVWGDQDPPFVTCSVCQRQMHPDARADMADAALCDRGGSPDRQDINGQIVPGEPRCPFKPTRGG